ncbi:endonuclease/Exonuclease/phosphatase, partial [Thecamonas trahens ATCC 50062]
MKPAMTPGVVNQPLFASPTPAMDAPADVGGVDQSPPPPPPPPVRVMSNTPTPSPNMSALGLVFSDEDDIAKVQQDRPRLEIPGRGKARRGPGSRSTGSTPRLKRAATMIVMREENGCNQVLLGQIEVVNAIASTPGNEVRNRFAGEFRFLGGKAFPDEATPVETVTRELKAVGFPHLDDFALQVVLLHKKRRFGEYEMHTFFADVRDNPQVLGVNIGTINEYLAKRREARRKLIESGEFFRLPRMQKMALAPKLHHLEWIGVDEALEWTSPERRAVNAYQAREFERLGVTAREVSRGTTATLLELRHLGSIKAIKDASLHAHLESFAVTHSLDPAPLVAQLYSRMPASDRAGSSSRELLRPLGGEPDAGFRRASDGMRRNRSYHALPSPKTDELPVDGGGGPAPQLRLLSYNVNVLPRGVWMFGTGQGLHASERLAAIAARISKGNYDVLALQELFHTPLLPGDLQASFVAQMHEAGFHHVVTSPKPSLGRMLLRSKVTDSGLIICSKYRIVESESLTFSSAGWGLDMGASKGVLYALVELGPRSWLHVFNCHLQAAHSGMSSRELAQIHARHLFSYVLTGDFNVDAIAESQARVLLGVPQLPGTAESDDYRRMMETLNPRGNVVDLLKAAKGRHVTTRPPRLRFPASMHAALRHKYPQRLDYFQDHDERQPFEFLSDHFGIETALLINRELTWEPVLAEEAPPMPPRLLRQDSRQRREIESQKSGRLCRASECGNVYELFLDSVRQHGHRPCLGERALDANGGLGSYAFATYDEVHEQVRDFGSGLLQLGLAPGSNVGILCTQRGEAIVAELACGMYSLVTVPLLCLGAAAVPSLIHELPLKVVVTSRAWTLEAVRTGWISSETVVVQVERLEYAERAAAAAAGIRLMDLEYVAQMGRNHPLPALLPQRSQVAVVVFTWDDDNESGREMVSRHMLSHGAIVDGIMGLYGWLGSTLDEHDVHYSFLPLDHVCERSFVGLMLFVGGRIGLSSPAGADTVFGDMAMLKPTYVLGTPVLFKKFWNLLGSAQSEWPWYRRLVFDLGFYLKVARLSRGRFQIEEWWDRLIFQPIASLLGSRLRFIVSVGEGGPPPPLLIQQFLEVVICAPLVHTVALPHAAGYCLRSMALGGEQDALLFPLRRPELVKVEPEQDGELCLRVVSTRDGVVVALLIVERAYGFASDLVSQIWCWMDSRDVLRAVVAVEHENVYAWARQREFASLDIEALCALDELKHALLDAFAMAWEVGDVQPRVAATQLADVRLVADAFT